MRTTYPPGPGRTLPGQKLWALHRDPLGLLLGLHERYGDIVHWRIGPQHVYLLTRADLAREVLVTHQQSFKKGPGFERTKIILGEGLLTSEGDFHLRQRRMIQPAFHRGRVDAYADVMVEEALRVADSWAAGTTVDVADEMMRLSLQVVSKTLFGATVSATEAAEIGVAMHDVVQFFDAITIAFAPLLLRLPLPSVRRFHAGCERLDRITFRLIAERRANPKQNGDVLSLLLAMRDTEGDGTGMSDSQVRDEVLTLLTAGHETTANALVWTWYLLSEHPEVEARLHEEIDSIVVDRTPGVEDARRLTYVEMVLFEAMRLFPTAWGIERRAVRDQAIGGYVIPAGAVVLMPMYVMNRDPRFFAEPLRFDPERFSADARERRPRHAFFPFGGGTRQCIGAAFAMLEAVLVIAIVARRWRLRLVPGHPVEPEAHISLRPKQGMPMTLESRPR